MDLWARLRPLSKIACHGSGWFWQSLQIFFPDTFFALERGIYTPQWAHWTTCSGFTESPESDFSFPEFVSFFINEMTTQMVRKKIKNLSKYPINIIDNCQK